MSTEIKTVEHLLVRVCRAHHTLASQKFEKLGLFRGQPPVLFELDHQDGMTHGELARDDYNHDPAHGAGRVWGAAPG